MRRCGVLFLVAGLILTVAATGAQASLAVDFTSPTTDFTNGNWSLGWKFTVNEPVLVTALGFYDDQTNDLTELHDVAIFDAAQQVVVSGQVAPGDPLISWWRWTGVTPTVLVPQMEYQIAAVTGTENYTWLPTGFVVDPRVNYLLDSYFSAASGVLTYPDSSSQTVGMFGPNFAMESVIPAPASVLLLIPGLMSLVGFRRRLS